MRVALCDDRKKDLELLCNLITENSELTRGEIEFFLSGDALLEAVRKEMRYDIVFLDVDMPGMNGITLGKELASISPDTVLIYATSYPQYAIEAFECEALQYLLKPLVPEKIKRALERALSIVKTKNHYIAVNIHGRPIRIPIRDICYVERLGNQILYHLQDRMIEVRGTLSVAYEQLKNYGFYQIHQGYIVNMEKIYDIKGYLVVLDDKREIPISVRKKTDVLIAYAKYLERS